jgi:N-hydroxyarylamine O-acetyltransferase
VKDDKGEVPLYVFRDVPRQLNEYEEMSAFHQTSPESGFTKRWICSKATRDGRITVANRRLIITAADRREETVLSTDDEVRRCLRDHFGIEFDDTADLSRLDSFPNG